MDIGVKSFHQEAAYGLHLAADRREEDAMPVGESPVKLDQRQKRFVDSRE